MLLTILLVVAVILVILWLVGAGTGRYGWGAPIGWGPLVGLLLLILLILFLTGNL